MFIPQKTQYAMRAIFEMSKHYQPGENTPIKIGDIAQAQGIPNRFLEILLNTLKKGGFVISFRGKNGGYLLSRSPEKITVGQVITFLQGPTDPVSCCSGKLNNDCPVSANCVFLPMWMKVKNAIDHIYDETNFQDLVNQSREKESVMNFSI